MKKQILIILIAFNVVTSFKTTNASKPTTPHASMGALFNPLTNLLFGSGLYFSAVYAAFRYSYGNDNKLRTTSLNSFRESIMTLTFYYEPNKRLRNRPQSALTSGAALETFRRTIEQLEHFNKYLPSYLQRAHEEMNYIQTKYYSFLQSNDNIKKDMEVISTGLTQLQQNLAKHTENHMWTDGPKLVTAINSIKQASQLQEIQFKKATTRNILGLLGTTLVAAMTAAYYVSGKNPRYA